MDNHVPGPGAYSPYQAPVPPVKKISALWVYDSVCFFSVYVLWFD